MLRQLRKALWDQTFHSRALSTSRLFSFMADLYVAQVVVASRHVLDFTTLRDALGTYTISDLMPSSFAHGTRALLREPGSPMAGIDESLVNSRNTELDALYMRMLVELAGHPLVRQHAIDHAGKIPLTATQDGAAQLGTSDTTHEKLAGASGLEQHLGDVDIATTLREVIQADRLSYPRMSTQGHASGIGLGVAVLLNHAASESHQTNLVNYGVEYRKGLMARHAARSARRPSIRNALLGNYNGVCVWVEEDNVLEEYYIHEHKGDTVGCVLLHDTRPLRAGQISGIFAGIPYVSFINGGDHLKVNGRFLPATADGSGMQSSAVLYEPQEAAMHSLAADFVMRGPKAVGRFLRRTLTDLGAGDSGRRDVPLHHGLGEAAVQQAFRVHGLDFEASRGLLSSDRGGEHLMRSASYATILAALAMWRESRIGKGIVTHTCLATTRSDGNPLIVAYPMPDPRAPEGLLKMRGKRRGDKVMVFAARLSPIWTRIALV